MQCIICNNNDRQVGSKCRNCYQKEYYHKNRDQLLELDKARKFKSYKNNKIKLNTKCKDYYKNNKIQILEDKKEYYRNNIERISERKKDYYSKNKSNIILNNLQYIVRRSKYDIAYKISRNLRSRLYQAIRNNYKSGSAVRDLGCSIECLKKYLESKFQLGMSWNNYGRNGWHIDHIKPVSSFDLTDKNQLKIACHYSNLQPLWAKDNLRKSNNEIL